MNKSGGLGPPPNFPREKFLQFGPGVNRGKKFVVSPPPHFSSRKPGNWGIWKRFFSPEGGIYLPGANKGGRKPSGGCFFFPRLNWGAEKIPFLPPEKEIFFFSPPIGPGIIWSRPPLPVGCADRLSGFVFFFPGPPPDSNGPWPPPRWLWGGHAALKDGGKKK